MWKDGAKDMESRNQCRCIRIVNQSSYRIKTETVYSGIGYGQMVTCSMIHPEQSCYLKVRLYDQTIEDTTIDLYYQMQSGNWVEFASQDVETLPVEMFISMNDSGVPVLREPELGNTNGTSGEMYYYQLYNNHLDLLRLFISYHVDGKYYSRKLSATAYKQIHKVWIPVEAENLTIKSQRWEFGWNDIKVETRTMANGNHCYVSQYFIPEGLRVQEILCT